MQEGHSRAVYNIEFHPDGSLAGTWYVHYLQCVTCSVLVSLVSVSPSVVLIHVQDSGTFDLVNALCYLRDT